ncbi:hypothetical protein MVLG_03570 [Microbotryum lychnidis-dioicae p1A1 Lamole]|uniref:Uncharacterized protein n=1 Tax=Microbotryum lychnidis-dioicae (strain p1A1 Lamole / MvSl-1064) TaxID=683840 RepID=U5H8L3_USTV1|nr:hypothetical protein MVLG_03570 [Microbotryum lychnidis-dioicae p1A1 Lamole]|eukprot:KDE06155.1 hypothetical protein MVLG_03570 [Microbotryum lychnidis-dioicae p1A1 Lamole]
MSPRKPGGDDVVMSPACSANSDSEGPFSYPLTSSALQLSQTSDTYEHKYHIMSANPYSNSANFDHGRTTTPSVDSSAPAPTATSQTKTSATDPEHTEYPEQRHAGKVGLGPNYKVHPTTSDKIEGQKDILVGKITRNEEKVQDGLDKKTGDKWDKEKAKDDAEDPFAKKEA